MKRPRPYIPLSARIEVAQRQLSEGTMLIPRLFREGEKVYLARLLGFLKVLANIRNPDCDPSDLHLDHDPALILRKFNPRTGLYTPRANDPKYLVYRTKDDHQHKTTGRKPGAEKTVTTKGSDIWLKSKFDRLEGRTKRRPKVKIPARKKPWPSRKFKRKSDV